MAPRIVLPGGTGYLGRLLSAWFLEKGWEVAVLSRQRPEEGTPVRHAVWNGRTLGPWRDVLEGAAAVVNLCGRSVNCRYTRANREEILASRIHSTRVLGQAIAGLHAPPPVWINASTAAIYRDARDRDMDEAAGEAGSGFSAGVAHAWEKELAAAPAVPDVRRVALRTSFVCGGPAGGAYDVLERLVQWQLGGFQGWGRQYVSWIHHRDFCRAVEHIIATPELAGPVNVTAPEPLPNAEFMRAFRRACNQSQGLPCPPLLVKLGALFMGTEPELVLKSRRVVPARLLASGFAFEHPSWPEAVASLREERRQQPPPSDAQAA